MLTKEAAYKAGVEQALMDMGLLEKQAGPETSALLEAASKAIGGGGAAAEAAAPSALQRLLANVKGLPEQFMGLPAWQQALIASGAGGAAGLGVGALTGHPGQGAATGAALGGGAIGARQLAKLLASRGALGYNFAPGYSMASARRAQQLGAGAAGVGGLGAGALAAGLTNSD